MTASILLPALISFSVSALLGPVVIPFLRKLKAMQTVREEGPVTHRRKNGTPTMGGILFLAGVFVSCRLFAGQYPKIIPVVFLTLGTHRRKNGTPTMGGILFLAGVFVSCRLFAGQYPKIIPVVFLTLGFGLVGLLDDYIKVILHRSMGLTALQKFSAQLLVTGIFAYYLTHYAQTELLMKIPFLPGRLLDIGVWSIPLLFLVVIGTVNGTNFTDGLDGLAGSVTVLVAVFFSVGLLDIGVWSIPLLFLVVIGTVNGTNFTDGLDGLAGSVTVLVAVFFSVAAIGTKSGIEPATCAVAGGLLGFLLFNVYPASVFMGDTGSLALGGFVTRSRADCLVFYCLTSIPPACLWEIRVLLRWAVL